MTDSKLTPSARLFQAACALTRAADALEGHACTFALHASHYGVEDADCSHYIAQVEGSAASLRNVARSLCDVRVDLRHSVVLLADPLIR